MQIPPADRRRHPCRPRREEGRIHGRCGRCLLTSAATGVVDPDKRWAEFTEGVGESSYRRWLQCRPRRKAVRPWHRDFQWIRPLRAPRESCVLVYRSWPAAWESRRHSTASCCRGSPRSALSIGMGFMGFGWGSLMGIGGKPTPSLTWGDQCISDANPAVSIPFHLWPRPKCISRPIEETSMLGHSRHFLRRVPVPWIGVTCVGSFDKFLCDV